MLVLLLVRVVLVFLVDPYVVCGFSELRVLCFIVGLIVFYRGVVIVLCSFCGCLGVLIVCIGSA